MFFHLKHMVNVPLKQIQWMVRSHWNLDRNASLDHRSLINDWPMKISFLAVSSCNTMFFIIFCIVFISQSITKVLLRILAGWLNVQWLDTFWMRDITPSEINMERLLLLGKKGMFKKVITVLDVVTAQYNK